LVSSKIASVPSVSSQCSSLLFWFSAVAPPAAPETVPLFSPIVGAVARQPASSSGDSSRADFSAKPDTEVERGVASMGSSSFS